jgi:hypothetical protein
MAHSSSLAPLDQGGNRFSRRWQELTSVSPRGRDCAVLSMTYDVLRTLSHSGHSPVPHYSPLKRLHAPSSLSGPAAGILFRHA